MTLSLSTARGPSAGRSSAIEGATYSGKDFYCDVALRDTAVLRVEFESDTVLAFHHTRPFWPVHIVVVPKQHVGSLLELTSDDDALILELLEVIKKLAQRVMDQHGAAAVLTNLGSYQDSRHLHFHISSGEPSNACP